MYCKNCGDQVQENAATCSKCGVSLGTKSFTLDTSAMQGFNAAAFFANRAHLLAVAALLACFLPWLKVSGYVSQSINCFGLSKAVDLAPGSILVSFLLYLLPLSLLGFLAADFVPQITKYKKHFVAAAAVLVLYAAIGLYQISHPEIPEMPTGMEGMNGMFGGMMDKARQMAADMISVGWGFYATAATTIGAFVLSRMR